jgi:antirestriction protein
MSTRGISVVVHIIRVLERTHKSFITDTHRFDEQRSSMIFDSLLPWLIKPPAIVNEWTEFLCKL